VSVGPQSLSVVNEGALGAEVQAHMESECARTPPNIVCRDLPPIVHDLIAHRGDCGSLRMRLTLVASSSLETPPGELPVVLSDAERLLGARCPP